MTFSLCKTTEIHNLGFQWTPWSPLDDLDFADDIALVSHNHQKMQQKTTHMASTLAIIGLNVSKDKTKVMPINNTVDDGIVLDGDYLEEVESFTYLGSVITKDKGADKDIQVRMVKQGQRSLPGTPNKLLSRSGPLAQYSFKI